MIAVKAWDSREGSPTVVMVVKERHPGDGDEDGNVLFVHGNLGWMGPLGLEEGSTALETGEALATAWGLQESEDPSQFVAHDPEDTEDGEDEDEEDDLDDTDDEDPYAIDAAVESDQELRAAERKQRGIGG